MNRLTALSFAMTMALGLPAHTVSAVEDPHAAHAAQAASGGQAQESAGGHAGGGMHEMMKRHMQEMREHGEWKHKGYADVVLQYADELKLSDEQIGKIVRIHQKNQEKFGQLTPKLRESLKAAHEVYLNPASDEAAIRKAAKEHSAVFDELVETALKSRNEINAVLTPEQLKSLQTKKPAT